MLHTGLSARVKSSFFRDSFARYSHWTQDVDAGGFARLLDVPLALARLKEPLPLPLQGFIKQLAIEKLKQVPHSGYLWAHVLFLVPVRSSRYLTIEHVRKTARYPGLPSSCSTYSRAAQSPGNNALANAAGL